MKKLLFGLLVMSFVACNNKKRSLPDVSNIKVDATVNRFDVDFFDTSKPTPQRMQALQAKHGKLFDYYLAKTFITDRIALGQPATVVVEDFIKVHKPLFDSTQLLYKKLDWLQNDLEKGFQYFQYHFKNFKVPKIYTIVDGFYGDNPQSYYGVEYGVDTVLISLQMFLGKNFGGYDPQIYYDYLRERFTKEYMVKNVFSTIINQKFAEPAAGSGMIDYMIDQGKRVYLLDQFLPNEKEEVKLGFTKKQLKDSYANEFTIWSHFVNSDILFEVEPSIIKEYVGENPYTKAFGTETPGNIGIFVGWQIVKKYMGQNPQLTLPQLMETENRKIYNEAKYKPSK
jgi:hypothetical protein